MRPRAAARRRHKMKHRDCLRAAFGVNVHSISGTMSDSMSGAPFQTLRQARHVRLHVRGAMSGAPYQARIYDVIAGCQRHLSSFINDTVIYDRNLSFDGRKKERRESLQVWKSVMDGVNMAFFAS